MLWGCFGRFWPAAVISRTPTLGNNRLPAHPLAAADHLATEAGLDQAQLRTIVRVLDNEPSLAPVWNWQMRGVRKYVQPARDFSVSQPSRRGR